MIPPYDYTGLINLERIKKNIKLETFNYIINDIEDKTSILKYYINTDDTSYSLFERYKQEIIDNKNILSNFYSKEALLAENKRLTEMIAKEIDPKEIEFLKGKIEFNTNFIKNNIKNSNEFISRKRKEDPILTNNYKKYRKETAKKYKKVSGKWVENVPATGGKRKTRKRKTRKHC